MKAKIYSFIILSAVLISSCTKDYRVDNLRNGDREEVKIAVILPLAGDMGVRWQRTAEWAMNNIEEAQAAQSQGVSLNIEWYDESSVDIEATTSGLALRDDIVAIVGPMYSDNALAAAAICAKYDKTMISTTSSSAELARSYAGIEPIWTLTETDITQCEVLLSKAKTYGAESVSLLAKEDNYGQTFIDWFAFQALELGLSVQDVVIYTDDSVGDDYKNCASSGVDYIICVPSSEDNLKGMVTAKQEVVGLQPKLLFSDVAYSSTVLSELGSLAQGIEGVAMYSDPSSGFAVAYNVKYGEIPLLGEAQFYDALMMVAYGSFLMQQRGEFTDINEALRCLVDGRDKSYGSWLAEDISYVFNSLADGGAPDISGASGSLDFDGTVYTNVLTTVYANWLVYGDEFVILDYNTSDGSNRTDATLASWNWVNSVWQEFEEGGSFSYPTLDDSWALVVATSTTWSNYRHQADALEFYQLLKSKGYDDDHIILIIEDDIAYNEKNPYPGVISSAIDGTNLYADVCVDYIMSDISPSDIESIFMGESSDSLPHVIGADSDDDILIFWSGHGEPDALNWGESEKLDYDSMRSMLTGLADQSRFRKMLWFVEACYSGSVAEASEELDGVMFITAANGLETSKADVFNSGLGVWMTNRFTTTLISQIKEYPDIIMIELYYKLFLNTVGSHATVYNSPYYDNLYVDTMGGFMKYN